MNYSSSGMLVDKTATTSSTAATTELPGRSHRRTVTSVLFHFETTYTPSLTFSSLTIYPVCISYCESIHGAVMIQIVTLTLRLLEQLVQ